MACVCEISELQTSTVQGLCANKRQKQRHKGTPPTKERARINGHDCRQKISCRVRLSLQQRHLGDGTKGHKEEHVPYPIALKS